MISNSEVAAMEGTAGEIAGGGERQRRRRLLRPQRDADAEAGEQEDHLLVSPPARKDGFTSAEQLRGLGCSSAAAAQAYSPSSAADLVRSSADWRRKGNLRAGERAFIDRRRGRRLEDVSSFLDPLPENTFELPNFRSDQISECHISSHGGLEETEEEDDWVIVKKQKITILIPPPLIESPIANNDNPSEPDIKPILARNTSSQPQEHNFYFPLVKPIGAVKQQIRALNFERRLERIGGLKKYLSSIRLEGFMLMIEREKLNKFQMVGLTMGKLKEMGADAVGPRRKLLHAIDLLCQDSPRWLL